MPFCDLTGKNIIITGASSGLGRSACILLSRLNASICLIARDKESLEATVKQMSGGNHLVMPYDLCDFEGYTQLFNNITNVMGRLNGLVHCAGIRKTLPLNVMKPESLDHIMKVNFYAFVELTRFLTKKSVINEAGGSIIGISSVLSLRGAPALTGYGSSKAAVDGFIRSLACELAPRKIRVNTIAPGHVETEMNIKVRESLSNEAYDTIIKNHPLGVGDPADVANLIAFLLSDEARWITGATIPIDGGFSIR
jgi:NAD(P)-dependent dehydrogenase (short-subunit alcohol dehydrogenase family)